MCLGLGLGVFFFNIFPHIKSRNAGPIRLMTTAEVAGKPLQVAPVAFWDRSGRNRVGQPCTPTVGPKNRQQVSAAAGLSRGQPSCQCTPLDEIFVVTQESTDAATGSSDSPVSLTKPLICKRCYRASLSMKKPADKKKKSEKTVGDFFHQNKDCKKVFFLPTYCNNLLWFYYCELFLLMIFKRKYNFDFGINFLIFLIVFKFVS